MVLRLNTQMHGTMIENEQKPQIFKLPDISISFQK